MAFEFRFPDVGEGITEGEIVKWKVKEGDKVTQDQVLADIETDKAVVQIPSPRAGTILKLNYKEGDTIKVGEVLVVIGDAGEQQPASSSSPSESVQRKSVGVVGELEEAPETPTVALPPKLQKEIVMRHLAAPATRRLARELHVDVEKITGTGADGRITEDDVRNAAETQTQDGKKTEVRVVKKYDFWGYIEHVPLKGMRKAIAKNMVQSIYTSPHVTHMDEADVTDLVSLREKEKKKAEKKGVKLTFLPFIIKAVIAALQDHPYLRAYLDQEHDEIIIKNYYNMGFAVDTEDGLMVPVIKGADRKKILDMSKEIQELAEKAKKRTIDLSDLKGSVFTITNIGSIGGLHATPIINPGESAILGLGRIYEKPLVKKGKIVIRSVLPLSLSFDHRVTDGAEAARFVNKLIEYLEDPDELLTEL